MPRGGGAASLRQPVPTALSQVARWACTGRRFAQDRRSNDPKTRSAAGIIATRFRQRSPFANFQEHRVSHALARSIQTRAAQLVEERAILRDRDGEETMAQELFDLAERIRALPLDPEGKN